MSDPPPPAPTKLTLIIPTYDDDGQVDDALPAHDEFEEHVRIGGLGRRVLGRADKIDLGKVRGELEDVQGQVDQLLAGIYDRTVGSMHLAQVQVSLTVTAEGSIGIATAGVQASIALVYERTPPPNEPVPATKQ